MINLQKGKQGFQILVNVGLIDRYLSTMGILNKTLNSER